MWNIRSVLDFYQSLIFKNVTQSNTVPKKQTSKCSQTPYKKDLLVSFLYECRKFV